MSMTPDSPRDPPAADALPGRGVTILVVDDEQAVGLLCRLMLNSLGYTVLLADSPATALHISASHAAPIMCLLTDVRMPTMDGRQLAESLLRQRPAMKVLFMSGYTAEVFAPHAGELPGSARIAKPFTRNDLERKLQDLLGPAPG